MILLSQILRQHWIRIRIRLRSRRFQWLVLCVVLVISLPDMPDMFRTFVMAILQVLRELFCLYHFRKIGCLNTTIGLGISSFCRSNFGVNSSRSRNRNRSRRSSCLRSYVRSASRSHSAARRPA